MIFLLLLCLLLPCACTPKPDQHEADFLQAETWLDSAPDSALALLQSLPERKSLSRRESARYALLLSRATNKCFKPLLPCDSLLEIALHYYNRHEEAYAFALLYKGRLEKEMGQHERATNYLLEGLRRSERFPQTTELRRHLLSSLGEEYYHAGLYEKAQSTLLQLLAYCETDRDKAVAMNRISDCYFMLEQNDSTLLFAHKAWQYALASQDSATIVLVASSFSEDYTSWAQPDSVLYYGHKGIDWCPQDESPTTFFHTMGKALYEKGENDSALYYISKALSDSIDVFLKADLLYTQFQIEQSKGNYQTAINLLEQYTHITDSLFFTDKSNEIQRLIHKYDTQTKIREQQLKERDRLTIVIVGFVCSFLLLLLYSQYRVNKRKRLQLLNEQRLNHAQEKLAILQNSIEKSQRIVTLLRNNLTEEKEKNLQEIRERETMIEKLRKEKIALQSWQFSQSPIYNKVEKLARQEVSNKRELKVLTDAEQKKLKSVVQEVYADCIAEWKSKYPRLSEEDLLYLCLEEAGLKQTAIALCFGNVDTHALAQRRYRMKERMKPKENGECDF